MFGSCFDVSWGVESPYMKLERTRCHGKMFSKRALSTLCMTQYAAGWQSYLPWKRKASTEIVFSHTSNLQQAFLFHQMSDPLVKGLISRVRDMFLHVLSNHCKHILESGSTAYEESGFWSVSMRRPVAILVFTWLRVPCTSNRPQLQSCQSPFASEIPRWKPS